MFEKSAMNGNFSLLIPLSFNTFSTASLPASEVKVFCAVSLISLNAEGERVDEPPVLSVVSSPVVFSGTTFEEAGPAKYHVALICPSAAPSCNSISPSGDKM